MRVVISLFCFVLLNAFCSYAQDNIADSLQVSFSSSIQSNQQQVQHKLDSVFTRFNLSADSLRKESKNPIEFTNQLDSLYRSLYQDDFINSLRGKGDSTGAAVQQSIAKMDSVVTKRLNIIDSLRQAHGVDGLPVPDNYLESLDSKIPIHLDAVGLKDKSSIQGLNNLSLHAPNVQVTSLNKTAIPNTPNLPNMPSVNAVSMPEEITSGVDMAKEVTTEVGQIQERADEVKNGDIDKTVDDVVDNTVMQTEELKLLKEQQQAAEKLKQQTNALNDLQAKPEDLKQQAKKHVVDYMAGKEDIIKNDLDKIAKLQLKHRDIKDSRFLPKYPPNQLKGKSFRERIVPGLSLQVFPQQDLTVDLAPLLAYRISGRWLAGASGYKRLTYFKSNDALRGMDHYGVRLFNAFRVINSFHAYTEWEYFKSPVKKVVSPSIVEYDSEWKSKWNFGMLNRYSIGKGFQVHFAIMYDLLKIKRFPNNEGAATRFGFDYQFKKKRDQKK